MRRIACLTVIALMFVVPSTTAAVAAAPDEKAAPTEPTAPEVAPAATNGDGFTAMDPADSENREELPAFPFLYAAYGIIWLGLFLYLISLGRRQRCVDAQIAELRAIVQEKVGKA